MNPTNLEHSEVKRRHRNRGVAENAEKGFFDFTTLRSQRLRGSNVSFVLGNLLEFYSEFETPNADTLFLQKHERFPSPAME